jgi:uncharacterized protein
MSRENVEIVLGAYEAFNRGDMETAAKAMDPEIEWNVPDVLPDAQVYHGHDGVKAFWTSWMETFDEFRIEIEEALDAGESVVVMASIVGRGRDSGIVVDTPSFGHIWTLRNGRAVLVVMKPNRRESLETVGLDPETN